MVLLDVNGLHPCDRQVQAALGHPHRLRMGGEDPFLDPEP